MALLTHKTVERRPRATSDSSRAGLRRQPRECVDCPVCGSARARMVCSAAEMAEQRRYVAAFYRRRWRTHNAATAADRASFTQDYTTDIVSCADCALLYRNPRPRPDAVTRAYRQDRYDAAYLAAEFENQRAWVRRKLPALAHRLRPGHGRRPQVLEVGSFVGALLAEGRTCGWEMFGVDPGEDVTAFCRARGLPVFRGTLQDADLKDGSFDAVVIWNTFDQLPDPRPTLDAAVRLLRDGGLLTIRIPNGACFASAMALQSSLPDWLRSPLWTALAWNNLLTFPYLYGYTVETLTALTSADGFRRVACLPDTLMPAPAGQITRWAAWEAQLYRWLCRASWHAAASERYPSAPWLDVYFERACSEDDEVGWSARNNGLGLIPVYAPLAMRQSGSECASEGGSL